MRTWPFDWMILNDGLVQCMEVLYGPYRDWVGIGKFIILIKTILIYNTKWLVNQD